QVSPGTGSWGLRVRLRLRVGRNHSALIQWRWGRVRRFIRKLTSQHPGDDLAEFERRLVNRLRPWRAAVQPNEVPELLFGGEPFQCRVLSEDGVVVTLAGMRRDIGNR